MRRLAIARRSEADEEALLREAAECYAKACHLKPYDTYPALNLVRLHLLLSRFEEAEREHAIEHLRSLEHLCAYHALQQSDDCWRAFDLADVLLLLARAEEGLAEYRRGIALVPAEKRASVLSSPVSALRELVEAKVLEAPVQCGVDQAIRELEAAQRGRESPATASQGAIGR